jgi:hypothetical protein
VTDGLLDCYKRFGVAERHVNDRNSHFKNAVLREFVRLEAMEQFK